MKNKVKHSKKLHRAHRAKHEARRKAIRKVRDNGDSNTALPPLNMKNGQRYRRLKKKVANRPIYSIKFKPSIPITNPILKPMNPLINTGNTTGISCMCLDDEHVGLTLAEEAIMGIVGMAKCDRILDVTTLYDLDNLPFIDLPPIDTNNNKPNITNNIIIYGFVKSLKALTDALDDYIKESITKPINNG